MTKEQIFKMIEGRIDTIQALSFECIELIYNSGYNEAIEDAALEAASHHQDINTAIVIRKLKK